MSFNSFNLKEITSPFFFSMEMKSEEVAIKEAKAEIERGKLEETKEDGPSFRQPSKRELELEEQLCQAYQMIESQRQLLGGSLVQKIEASDSQSVFQASGFSAKKRKMGESFSMKEEKNNDLIRFWPELSAVSKTVTFIVPSKSDKPLSFELSEVDVTAAFPKYKQVLENSQATLKDVASGKFVWAETDFEGKISHYYHPEAVAHVLGYAVFSNRKSLMEQNNYRSLSDMKDQQKAKEIVWDILKLAKLTLSADLELECQTFINLSIQKDPADIETYFDLFGLNCELLVGSWLQGIRNNKWTSEQRIEATGRLTNLINNHIEDFKHWPLFAKQAIQESFEIICMSVVNEASLELDAPFFQQICQSLCSIYPGLFYTNAYIEKIYLHLVRLELESVASLIIQAAVAINEAHFDLALQEIELILEQEPNQAMAHSLAGHAYLKMGDHASAEHSLNRALELEPDHLLALNSLSLVFKHVNKIDQAIATIERALVSHPFDLISLARYADYKHENGQLEETIVILEKLLTIDPENERIRNQLKSIQRNKLINHSPGDQ